MSNNKNKEQSKKIGRPTIYLDSGKMQRQKAIRLTLSQYDTLKDIGDQFIRDVLDLVSNLVKNKNN